MNTSKKKISYSSPHELAELEPCESVLLAYSGGSDSTALLHILRADAEEKGYTLHLAHLDHGIRGEEAERDAKFCKAQAERYGLPFHFHKEDIPALAKQSGNSIEAEARERRYAFFKQVMLENGIKLLATAHHADDQTETVLLHILRGSGITGLRGMSECRTFFDNDTFLVRPLLHTEKKDITRYLDENGFEFVEDSTNTDKHYMRNAIRAEITPRLRKLQPKLNDVMARLAQNAKDADDLIYAEADDFIFSYCQNGYIPTEKLLYCFPVTQARILSELFKNKTGASLEQTHITSIIELCAKRPEHAEVSLPSYMKAVFDGGHMRFRRRRTDMDDDDLSFSMPFSEGDHRVAKTDIRIKKLSREAIENEEPDGYTVVVPMGLVDKNTVIRTRLPKDAIMINNVHKKVKKLLCDKKVPLPLRASVPMLACGSEILWIPDIAVCDAIKRDKLNDDAYYIIKIKIDNDIIL